MTNSDAVILLMNSEYYKQGYNQGVSDVLNKIRTEIEEVYLNITYEENHKVGGTWGLRKALEIIDKYKAESEEKNDNNKV